MSHKKSKFIEIIIIVGIIVVCVNTGPMLTRIKLKVEYGDYVNISLADVMVSQPGRSNHRRMHYTCNMCSEYT